MTSDSFLSPLSTGGLCITHIFLKHCAIASRSGFPESNGVVQVSTIAGFEMRSRFGVGLPHAYVSIRSQSL